MKNTVFRCAAVLTLALLLFAALSGCAPAVSAPVSASAGPVTPATPAATEAPGAASPSSASSASLDVLDPSAVLALLGAQPQTARYATADLDGDGVVDAVALYPDASGMHEGYVTALTLASVNGATKAVLTLPLSFADALAADSIGLMLMPAGKTGAVWYAVVGGMYGGTVEHVGYSIVKWAPQGWTDIFAKYRDTGMPYTLTMQDGPKATLTLENGNTYPLEPADITIYQDNGWIDKNGKLTPNAHVFDEHTGFSSLTPSVAGGLLTLAGTQEIRGLHKLDVLATLLTTWQYDGADWTVVEDVEPVMG